MATPTTTTISPNDAVSALYSSFGAWRQFYANFRIKLARLDQVDRFLPRTGTILDLGCGFGVLANYVAIAGPERRVIGIDLNQERITTAQATVKGRSNISFLSRNVMKETLPTCDAVIMSDFLHHLTRADQITLIKRTADVMNPKGLLLIQEVNTRPRFRYICSSIADAVLYPREPRPNFRAPEDWTRICNEAGYQNIQVIPGDAGSPFARVSYIGTR